MWQVFTIFWRAEGTRPMLVLLCLVLGGFAEALGIGIMLPVLQTALEGSSGASGTFGKIAEQALAWLGLPVTMGGLILVVLVIMTFRSLILFATMTYAGVTSARVTINLRRRLVKALFDARWSYYAGLSSGRVANSLGNDAQSAGNAYSLSASTATILVQIVAYAVAAALVNWQIALIGIAAGLFLALASKQLLELTRRAGFKQVDRVSAFAGDTTAMLQNIKALKAMNRFEAPLESLSHSLKRLKRTLFIQYIAKYALHYSNDLLIVAIVSLGTWIAFSYAAIPATELVVIGVLFFQVISYVNKFLKQLQAAIAVEAAHARVTQLIGETEAAAETNGGLREATLNKSCQFQHVSFAHAEQPVVRDVSFTIEAGKITVLQGPSGAGKTTILDLLVGFHKPDKGKIFVDGTDLSDVDLKKWRTSIGYVPQELVLFHDTIRDNVTLYDEAISEHDLREALLLSGVESFLPATPNGLDTDVGELGGRLSGGQRQRIALARALVRKPKLLILDEVTSALDPETETEIVNNIANLRGRYTIVAITHRPAWTSIADTLLKVDAGQVTQVKQQMKRANPTQARPRKKGKP